MTESSSSAPLPHVLIIGGGFAGMAAAQGLKDAPVRVTLLDRTNHHLFQPLLYQVATAMLTPGDIASPIRQLVAQQPNVTTLIAEVTGIDAAKKIAYVTYLEEPNTPLHYDYLIVATGARHSYFGKDHFERFAPGLKSLADATAVRNHVLAAFERAEMEAETCHGEGLLTFVIVGGGPTGVELAGAIAELRKYSMRRDFRRIDPQSARILLVQSGPRILPTFHESLSTAAQERLRKLGVEVRLNCKVEEVDELGVRIGDERVASKSVLWAAGVKPSPAAQWLGVEADKGGRVKVGTDCSVPGLESVFVLGDTAAHPTPDGGTLPGLAQPAMQQGAYVADLIRRRVLGEVPPPPFSYFDKGNMAIIGRNFAVLEKGPIRMSGFLAWLAWAYVHIAFLGGFENRIVVAAQWIWSYLTNQRGSRLILEPRKDPWKLTG
ncbi:MAG: NAD(P)/FAD-dependent oxidoreductase [Verrucomicrobia bacterium]|nr:NAD(P)/FAD-dependent oxidoreductase [Verrucomicrobiota bacterium]